MVMREISYPYLSRAGKQKIHVFRFITRESTAEEVSLITVTP